MFSRIWMATVWVPALLLGCVTPRIRPVQSFVDPPVAGEILVADSAAWQLVALTAHRALRDDEGHLHVEVELRNLSGLDLPIEMTTVFHGMDGQAFADQLDWEAVVIPGSASHRHFATSATVEASSFRVLVRTP